MTLVHCRACGTRYGIGALACPRCGRPGRVREVMPSEQRVGWLVAFIVAAMLALMLQP
jgi:uncharacterized paraquat-inducible protein A